MQAERNLYFDYLRGVAILMVIGIHTFIGGGFTSFYDYLNTGIRQVLNCAVPIFIACSGYFLANKNLNDKQDLTGFYKKQISRVYIPCLLWSIPWLSVHILGGNGVVSGILNLVFCGFSVFYFVILMIQYYLLLPAIQKVRSRMGGVLLICSIICSLVCVALVMYITAIKGIQVPLTLYAGPFPLWIVFFVLGVVLAGNRRNYKLGYIIIGIVLLLILQVIESKWLLTEFQHGVGFGIKPSSFLFSILVILLVFSNRVEGAFKANISFNKAIAFVGRVSFVVYLSHTFLIFVLSRVHFFNNIPWGGRFIIVSMMDLVLVCLLYHFTPQKWKRAIGF